MKLQRGRHNLALPILGAALLWPAFVGARESGQAQEGINQGDYNIRQSVELGYRFTDFSGNQDVFDTFVNLSQGVRLLNQTLEMRSLDHNGLLFDDFFLTSFGYGGDPNDVSMLRVSKNKWYSFSGNFRRDRNLWNYNLLGNPLNPVQSDPSVPITYSPHLMRLSRRMSDFNLTLLPQSRVRFRLAYTRNINEGPSLTTFHEGTDMRVFQDWKTTVNAYQAGVDVRLLPKTNISYDQFLQYYKGDTSWMNQTFGYQLANGTPVDLGIIFNTSANQPCASPLTNAGTNPPTASPTCNGYLAYARGGRVRTSYPVEQLSFQSRAIKNLDMAGRFAYSSSDSKVPMYNEFLQGLVTRTLQRQFSIQGDTHTKRVSVSTDLAATYSIHPKFRIVDEFRFWNFRIPGQWVSSELSLFGRSMATAPVVFNPAACPSPYNAATCPPHTSSSPADVASGVSSRFLGQDIKLNTFQLEYDLTRRIGGRLGYRYRHRTITHRDTALADELFYPGPPPPPRPPAPPFQGGQRGDCTGLPLNPDGSCQTSTVESGSDETTINEHSLLLGIWSRPLDPLRVSFDLELMSADRAFTRISPRQIQHYKLRAKYKPAPWFNLGGSVNVYEARNNVVEVNHLQHSRSYGFNASIAPDDRWSMDLGYDYNNIFSQTNICFVFGSGQAPPGFPPCTVVGSPVPLQAISLYKNTTNFVYGDFMVRPIKRVTLNMGYAVSSVSGNTLILNPNAFPGPLQFTYSKPYASVAIDLVKGWTWNTAWGFYNYDEKVYPGDSTAPRSFRGNLVALSMRYSF